MDEEGLLRDSPKPNPIGCILYGTAFHGSPIVGTIVMMKMGYYNGEPDIVGLDDNEIRVYLKSFYDLREDIAKEILKGC